MKFYIVDAFSSAAFGGNPAGVVMIPEGDDFPSVSLMQKTAAELRYSETAFVKKLNKKEFHTRYFTPAAEVDLCGHATISAFSVMLKEGMISKEHEYMNHTLAGDLEIAAQKDFIMMEMAVPEHIKTLNGKTETETLFHIMGIPAGEVFIQQSPGDKKKLLPMIISTGLPDILLPVSSRNALFDIDPDFDALSRFSEEYEVTGVHAFTLDAAENDITAHCRNFAPLYDIDEEAATGTANGALTYYLFLHDLIKDGQDSVFIQGESMERPSRILSHIKKVPCYEKNRDSKKDDFCLKIQIGGTGMILAAGEIFI